MCSMWRRALALSSALKPPWPVCACRPPPCRSIRWRPVGDRWCGWRAAGCRWGPSRPERFLGRPAIAVTGRSPSPTRTCCWGVCRRGPCRRCSGPLAINPPTPRSCGAASKRWPPSWFRALLAHRRRLRRRGPAWIRHRYSRRRPLPRAPAASPLSGWPTRSDASRSSAATTSAPPCS